MNKLIEFKSFEAKGVEYKNDEVSGYGAVFGNVDRTGDIIHKGAFKKTISENKGSVVMVANHKQDKPVGRVTSMEEDDYGLKFSGYTSNTESGQEYKQLMKDGVIDSFSIGYKVTKWDRNEHGGRNIYELKLFEISPVAIPMNPEAKLLEVKSISEEDHREEIISRFELLAKNLGDKKKRLQNEAELLKLAEEYKAVTQPAEVTEPIVEEAKNNNQFLTALSDALKNN